MATDSANGMRNRRRLLGGLPGRLLPSVDFRTGTLGQTPGTIGQGPLPRFGEGLPQHLVAFTKPALTCSNDPAEFVLDLDDPMGQVSQEPQRLLLACHDDPVGGVVLVRRTAQVLDAGLAANVGP